MNYLLQASLDVNGMLYVCNYESRQSSHLKELTPLLCRVRALEHGRVAHNDVPRKRAEVKREHIHDTVVSNPSTRQQLYRIAASFSTTQSASQAEQLFVNSLKSYDLTRTHAQ